MGDDIIICNVRTTLYGASTTLPKIMNLSGIVIG